MPTYQNGRIPTRFKSVIAYVVIVCIGLSTTMSRSALMKTTSPANVMPGKSKHVVSCEINEVVSKPTLDQQSFLATNTTSVPFYIVGYTPSRSLLLIIDILRHRAPRFHFYQVNDLYEAKLVLFSNNGRGFFDDEGVDFNSVMQNAVVVQWSGEFPYVHIPLNIVKMPMEIGSGHPRGPKTQRGRVMEYYRLPYGIIGRFDQKTCWLKKVDELRIKDYHGSDAVNKWRKREYNASMFVNHLSHPRGDMFKNLESWLGSVVSGGKALHNTPEPWPVNKLDYLSKSKFTICPENKLHEGLLEGYVTEKLYQALLSGAIPVYWPKPDPEPRMFNSKRIIYYDPANPEATKNKIQDLMTNDESLLQFFNEPIFVEGAKSYAQTLCNDFADGIYRRLESLLHEAAPSFSDLPYRCRNKLLNSKAQEGQDKFMFEHAFRGVCHGTFVELGGADGISNSNTYAAEVDMGWQGVLLEASPTAYRKLARQRGRNHSHKLLGAVGDEEKNVTYIENNGPQPLLSGVKEFATEGHLARIKKDMEKSNSTDIKYILVPMKPLTTWLEMYGLRHVNWLCLDIKGAEIIVLKTLDFTKIKVDFFQIEKNGKQKEILQTLEPHGYQLYKPWMEAYPNALDTILCHKSVC